MTRRKVTMLEAFQASAKESAERAAAERRRLIAEREKEIRCAESGRSQEDRADIAAVFPGRSVHDAPAMAPVDVTPPPAGVETEVDRPASEAPDAALPVGQIPPVSAGDAVAAPEIERSAKEPEGAVDAPKTVERPSAAAAEVDLDPTAMDEDVFALPMTGRGFASLLALLLAGVFIIGWTVGRRSSSSAAPPSFDGGGGESRLAGAGLDPIDFGPAHGMQGAEEAAPAAPDAGSTLGAAPETEAADEVVPLDPDTEADRAFWDPAMRYTVLAITYSRSDTNVELAWDAYDQLLAGGLPVVKPVERDGRIFVFVGAEEAVAELDDLKARVASFRSSPGGSNDYRSAYVVNLSQYR